MLRSSQVPLAIRLLCFRVGWTSIGRVGDWDPAAQLGNPMHSMQIRDMIKGYYNQAAELGY